MQRTVDREEGVAYGFYMAILFIIVAALVLAMFSPVVNSLMDYSNTEIEAGTMSVQTASAVGWNAGAFVWLPVFCLIGIFLWAVVRALEQKKAGS